MQSRPPTGPNGRGKEDMAGYRKTVKTAPVRVDVTIPANIDPKTGRPVSIAIIGRRMTLGSLQKILSDSPVLSGQAGDAGDKHIAELEQLTDVAIGVENVDDFMGGMDVLEHSDATPVTPAAVSEADDDPDYGAGQGSGRMARFGVVNSGAFRELKDKDPEAYGKIQWMAREDFRKAFHEYFGTEEDYVRGGWELYQRRISPRQFFTSV